MSFADYLENALLDHLFGKATFTSPAIHVALSTADPLEDGSGLAEPSGNGYARVATAPADWNASASGLVDNLSEITFPQATGAWGTVTHFALFDAATAGNMLLRGALTTSKSIDNGDTAKFAAGDLDVTLD